MLVEMYFIDFYVSSFQFPTNLAHTERTMNPPLPTHKAKEAALLLQEALDLHKTLDFEGEKCISTDYLFGPAMGQMFGVLVCEDQEGAEVGLRFVQEQFFKMEEDR